MITDEKQNEQDEYCPVESCNFSFWNQHISLLLQHRIEIMQNSRFQGLCELILAGIFHGKWTFFVHLPFKTFCKIIAIIRIIIIVINV